MIVYFIIIFLLFLFSINEVISENKELKKEFLYISYFLIVFAIGLRWEMGTDWTSYYNLFTLKRFNLKEQNNYLNMEYGFILFNYIVRKFTNSYSVFLVIQAIIVYSFIIKAFTKITRFPQTTLFLFFCITLGFVGANRQFIAVAIGLYALTFLIGEVKKTKIYLSLVILASAIHISSLLFGLYFFINKRIKSVYLITSVLIAFIVGNTKIPYYLFSLAGIINERTANKVEAYLNIKENVVFSILGVVRRLLLFFLLVLYKDKINEKMKNYYLILNGYIISLILYFLFYNTLPVMVSRGGLLFTVMEPILLSSFLYILKSRADKAVFVLGLTLLGIIFMYQSISAYPNLFEPYQSIFINTEFRRKLY